MNSGKTTVAKILAQKLPKTAHVEKLRQFIEWMPIKESIPYNIKNIISLTKNFAEEGLNVIISYPISNEHYQKIVKELRVLNTKIFAFTLSPPLAVALSNRGNRQLADWEMEVIKQNYEENFHKPSYGTIIDNSKQTPEETANLILEKLR